MRIAHIAPVATTIPPPKSGSVETMTSLLTEGLVAHGHDVTLFATADSRTKAKLCAIYPHGYWHDENMWPWELYEMLNLAAAVERAQEFDIIHYEAAYYPMSLAFTRLSRTPIVQTLHHSPSAAEVALWATDCGERTHHGHPLVFQYPGLDAVLLDDVRRLLTELRRHPARPHVRWLYEVIVGAEELHAFSFLEVRRDRRGPSPSGASRLRRWRRRPRTRPSLAAGRPGRAAA